MTGLLERVLGLWRSRSVAIAKGYSFVLHLRKGVNLPLRPAGRSGMVPAAARTTETTMDTRRSILTQLAGRPMSLAGLAGATGASLPTLRRAVHELTSSRWIRVVGREEATGGRPANLFGLDDDVLTLVGVHLAHPGMRLVATDLTGRVLDDVVPPKLYDLEPDAVHRAVLAFLADLRRRRPHRRVVGLGIATPGFIDRDTGSVVTIGRVPNWNNLPLAERLREATDLHVTIGNDLDALATAEFGLGEEARTYAYVGYAEGVKFTMFLDGAPYTGPFGNAGLVGPALLAGDGDVGDAELLRMHGLVSSFERRAAGTGRRPPERHASSQRTPAEVRARLDEILGAAAQGEQPAQTVIDRMLGVLGDQVAAFVHLLQPELLVIGGGLAGAPSVLLDRLEANVRRRLPTLLDNALIVRRARVVEPEATAVGATRVFLQRFLTEETVPVLDAGAATAHEASPLRGATAVGTVGHDRSS